MASERWRAHRRGHTARALEWDVHRRRGIAVGEDCYLIAFQKVDEMISMMVECVLLTNFHREESGDPLAVLSELLVALRYGSEGADVARRGDLRLTAWLASLVRLFYL